MPSTIQTRQTVFYHFSRNPDESSKYDAQRSIFDEQQQVAEVFWGFFSIFISVCLFRS